MMNLVSLIKEDPVSSYDHWKRRRTRLLNGIQSKLLGLSEQNLMDLFDSWDTYLLSEEDTRTTSQLLNKLTVFSILFFCQVDYNTLNTHQPFLQKLINGNNSCLIRSVCKVFYWIAVESSDFQKFSTMPQNYINQWLNQDSSKCWENVLYLMNCFLKLNLYEFPLKIFSFRLKVFLEMTHLNDSKLRKIAINIIKFQITHVKLPQGNQILRSIFLYGIESIQSNNEQHIESGYAILHEFYEWHFSILDDLLKTSIQSSLNVLKQNENRIAAISANYIIILLGKYQSLQDKETISQLLDLCLSRLTNSSLFIPVLDCFIKNIPNEDYIDQILSHIRINSHQISSYDTEISHSLILNTILDYFPNRKFDEIDLETKYFDEHFCLCLKRQFHLFDSFKNKMIDYFNDYFGDFARKRHFFNCIVILREFPLLFFDNMHDVIDSLIDYSYVEDSTVRVEIVKAIAAYKVPESINWLIEIALYDDRKEIRSLAHSYLSYDQKISTYTLILQAGNDPSFKIRRKSLKIIGEMNLNNPLDIQINILDYQRGCLRLLMSVSNPKDSYKYSSLIYSIVKNKLELNEFFVLSTIKAIITIIENRNFKITDTIHDALISNQSSSEHDVKKSRLYKSYFNSALIKRHIYLMKTITALGSLAVPFRNQILDMYSLIFENELNIKALLATAKSLIKFIYIVNNELSERIVNSRLSFAVYNVFSNAVHEQLNVQMLILVGLLLNQNELKNIQISLNHYRTLPSDFNEPGFFTDFVFNSILSQHETNLMIFSVMTKIIEAEPEYSAKYINKIFPLFLKTCNRPSYKHREILFEYMGIISTKCKNEIVPFFPYISLLVKKFIDSVSCIKYLTLLSYTFNSLFTPFAEDLFYLALSKLDNTENNYVKYLLKLLSICGIVHNLWFDSYIHALEEKIRKGISSYFAKQILKNMLIVISLSDYFQIFISRIILIAVSILPINYESAMNILSCIYNDHINDYQYITYMLESKNISCKDLQNYKYTIPKLEIKVISVYEKPIGRPKDKNIFVGIQYQPEETINSFFDELFRVSLTYTPSPAIYSCRDLSTQSLPFVQHLLPFAFLSCWKEASDADRKYLSGLLNRIINEHSQLHPMFIRLVEVLHRTKIAPKIDLLKFVNLSSSHQFSLYLLEKTYLHEPNNQEVIKKLIDLNLSMNRISIAQSLFNKIQPNLKKIQQAEMSMSLGHWEKALDLYSDEINCNCDFEKGSVNSHLPMITEALYKLHRYSDILKYEKEFEESEGDEKDSLLLPFAWAYFQNENMEKLKPIINQLPKNSTLPRMLLVCLYYLSIQKLDKAQDTIDKTCQYIVMHKELLTSFGEFYQMQDTLSMIQLIVECNEVSRFLSGKKHTTESLLKLWYHRIKGYHRDEFSWLVLLNLHKRLIDYDMNIHYTLKIISQIRKDRQFKTFISYFAPFFQFSTDCDVILANIKIMWAMKTHSKVAFNSLSNIVKILGDKPYKLFVETFSKNYIALGQILIQSVCFNHKELDLDVKQEMLSYCNFHHFEEFLANYRNLPTEKISNLINHLVKKHPEPVFEAINKNILKKITPNQKSRFYRLYADYSSLINANNQTNLQESINYLEIASSLSPNDQKIWKLYGKLNLQMMSLCFDNNNNYNEFAQNAIKAYSKAIVLRPSDSDDCIVQITYALQNSNLGGKIEDYLDAIYQVPNSVLKKVVPQLLINISHTNDFVSNITVNILSSFGAEHFQAVLYDLNLYTLVENKKQSNFALKLLRSLAQQNLEIAKDASLFIDGMVRCSMTWFECWINAIEKSLQLVGSNPTAARQVIHEQLKQYENPRCEFDYMFIEMYSVIIQKIQQLYHKNTSSSNKFMWNSMNSFLRVLKEQENRLSTLFLNKISLELFNKRGFQLACLGKYKVEGDFPLIYQIESAMEIILTQQHPRQITMIANTGEKFKYLLKGNEDLRLDQRIMQFFELVNTILRKDIKTKEIGAIISRYPVIPITPYSGFISWVINSDTMYQMVMDYRKAKGETLYPDFEQLHEYSVVDFQLLNSLQRLESYQYVCEKYKAHELFNTFWIKSPNAAIWQYRREKYTISSAVMSMIGYIIGLGDRHPGNIMIQRDSGNVTHIDFGDSFEAATLRSSFPEKVPFRLTRMITNAFCGCTNDGYFKMICEAVMTVLRYNGTTLSTQLSIFMCEIFDNYCGRDKYYMKRINAKLHGQKWENGELVPIHETDIEEHVNNLINEAENPFNFARHYSGWCPFW